MDNILINFTAETSGLQPGIDGLVQLETVDKELATQVKQTAVEINKRDKLLSDGAKAGKKDVEALTGAMNNLSKVQIGSAFVSSLKSINNEMVKITAIRAGNIPFVDDAAKRMKFLQGVVEQTKSKIDLLRLIRVMK